jgi:hypothetical protein
LRRPAHFLPALLLCGALLLTASGCSSTSANRAPADFGDPYYQRTMASAHAAFARGDTGRAAELYANALTRAYVMDRAPAISAAAYHLALCRILTDAPADGLRLLEEARRELRREEASGTDIELAMVEALRQLDRNAEAWTLTEQLLAQPLTRVARVHVHGLRGLMALANADADAAAAAAAQARQSLRRDTPPALRARLAELEGRLATLQGQPAQAATAFDEEADLYGQAQRFADRASARVRAAAAYRAADDPAAAIDRYYRAGRHYAAREDVVTALRLLAEALPLAGEMDDPESVAPLLRLYDEVEQAVKKAEERRVE